MTIASVSITPVDQRLADQGWRYATAAIAAVPGFVLGLADHKGETGLGYVRAMPPAGVPPSAMRAVLEYLTDGLPGMDETDISDVMAGLEKRLHGFPMAKAAVECALIDLAARAQRLPLHRLIGDLRAGRLPQARIVPLRSPTDMAENAARLIDQGYRFLKIKASGEPALDLARIEAVGRVARNRARLMVDANQSYSVRDAIRTIPRMADAGVELVEQPTAATDPRGFERVCRAVPVPVEADESAQSLEAILHLAAERIVDSINLRILNLGGIRNVLQAAAICRAAGIACRFGASFGPRLLHAFTAHVAATLPEPLFAHEIAEFEHILDDPFEGIDIEDGDLVVPQGFGTGVWWRESAPRTRAKGA